MSLPIRFLGTGSYLPTLRVSAADLDRRLGLRPGTALDRNGVAFRHFAEAPETLLSMAAAALGRALEAAALGPRDLDAILFTGVLPEQPMPATAVLLHRAIGARPDGVTCFDLNASCVGFLKACDVAAAGIASGLWRRVAIVAAEYASKGLRWDDLDTCTLFGDGAAAAILGPSTGPSAFLLTRHATWSDGAELCAIRAGGSRWNVVTPPPDPCDYLFAMQGRPLLRLVKRHFPAFLEEILSTAPVDLVLPHQASAVGLAFLRKQLAPRGIPTVEIFSEVGNQVTASLPTVLDHAIRHGHLSRGQSALLVGTAAGVALSGLVLRY